MNPLFPCDHGAATHSCIRHDTGRGTLCKNASRCRSRANMGSLAVTRAVGQLAVRAGESIPVSTAVYSRTKMEYSTAVKSIVQMLLRRASNDRGRSLALLLSNFKIMHRQLT